MKAMHWLLLAAVLAGCFAFLHEAAAGGFKKGQEATLSFHSFDGGGPSYDVELGSDIVSYECKRKYARADHDRLCGAGYDVIYTFRGVRSGQTTMKVKMRSPIAGNEDRTYAVTVDEHLNVGIKHLATEDLGRLQE